MAAKVATLPITDLSSGVNNSDSPSTLAPNQVVDARNVDLREGKLYAKRRGSEEIELTDSILTPPIVGLFRYQPSNNIGNDELWAIDADGNLDRRVGGVWQGGVPTVNDHVGISAPFTGDENGVSLHGKLFITGRGSADRLIVWDGSVLRWAGFAQAPDPTVSNTGSGSYSGTRYVRVRYIEKDANDVVLRRSEPSNTVAFVPSGSGSGIVITKDPDSEDDTTPQMEGQTHWEVELSVDNILFYRVATVAIGTATYTDSTAYNTGYSSFPLSEQIGEYIPPHSVRHVAADEDRLMMAGARFSPAEDATVFWSPVEADDGVGNDERIPATTRNRVSLDGLAGGEITILVAGISGSVYAFKQSRIYKLTRTGVLTSAYETLTESESRGALMRGACAGTDPNGNSCVYALDKEVGLIRVGQDGVRDLAWDDIRQTWRNRNRRALPTIVYYPELQQVWYFVPTSLSDARLRSADGSYVRSADGNYIRPNTSQMFVFDTRRQANLFHSGLPAATRAAVIFPDVATFEHKPIISIGRKLLRADTGTNDAGQYYRGYVRTKPFELGGGFTKFGILSGVVHAQASDATLGLKLIRDYGKESKEVTADLNGSQSHVHVPVDNATMRDCLSVQIEYGDPELMQGSDLDQTWGVDSIVLRHTLEGDAA